MAITHLMIHTWQGQNGNSIAKTITSSAGSETSIDEVIPASSTDLLLAFGADVSQIKSIYICAAAAMTLETNSSSAPANVITLAAGIPYQWTNQDGVALRDTAGTTITTDITALYVTSADGGLLQIRMLIDPTV